MASYFPQVTGAFKYEEHRTLRRFSLSIVEMALVTGVVLRFYRAMVLSLGPSENLAYLAAAFALGVAIFCTALTLHVGNFTPRRWLWRAPAFAALEAVAESVTSLLLILLHREPVGSARATMADWPALALDTFFWRMVVALTFTAALAGVMRVVRKVMERA
ncbi:MAG: hypothetical protein ACT4OZ_01005 [Gemmatimonadota bacterium]